MIKMTSDAYRKLKQYENVLAAAYKGEYLNAPYLIVKDIKDIALTIGYNGHADLSCTRCRLNLAKTVGKAYFEYKAELQENAAKARAAKAAKEKASE